MSVSIHKDPKFGKLIPHRFVRDALRNGVRAEVGGEKIIGDERLRRLKREEGWLKAGPQYGTYSMLLGFSRKVRGRRNDGHGESS